MPTGPSTRRLFVSLLALPGLSSAAPQMQVYKTKTCGCCGKWVEHVRANGIAVTVTDVPSTAESRLKFGVPDKLSSCHTGVIGGYAIEGHVPVADIQRLLREKPKGKGLSVPGMPMGSPGMEGAYRDAYSVLLFDEEGHASVFNKYPGSR